MREGEVVFGDGGWLFGRPGGPPVCRLAFPAWTGEAAAAWLRVAERALCVFPRFWAFGFPVKFLQSWGWVTRRGKVLAHPLSLTILHVRAGRGSPAGK